MVQAGKYVCDKNMNVVKTLNAIPVKDPRTGEVQRVYGSWATEKGNLIQFKKGVPVVLDKNTANLPHIQHLIENGILKRVL